MTESFWDWAQLIDHVRAEYPLWYHASTDVQPIMVSATVRSDGKLRISSWRDSFDPFTADAKHLDRFRRNASRVTLAELQPK